MKNLVLLLMSAFFVLTTIAQEKPEFSSQNSIGLLEGENGSSFQLQTINGISYKKWFTGLGIGLDYYYLRSVPLFLSINHNILNKKRTPFVSVNAGINFPWIKNNQETWGVISSNYTPALYMGGNLGYKLGLKNNDAVLLLVGYSFKELKEKREMQTFCIDPPCPPSIEKYDYNLKRISLKLGYQF